MYGSTRRRRLYNKHMQIVVDDLLVQYELTGKGKLVLLLHGWGDSSKGLSGLQGSLSEKYQTLSVDLPGFGASQAPKATWGLDDYAVFIAHTLEKLQLKDLYAVIGHSNGGAITIRATATHKLTPQKLVLIASSGVRNTQTLRRSSLALLAKAGNAVTFWLPQSKREDLRRKLYKSVGSDLLVAPGMEETFKRVVKQDVQTDCANVAQETLLIYGTKDEATPLAYGERYHELLQASDLKVIDGAGHFVHLEQADKITDEIGLFLA